MRSKSIEYNFFKISLLTALLLLSALNYNILISPSKIVAGGVNGLSIIICKIFNIQPALVILIISFSILLFGIIYKEYELVLSALYASSVYPLFVYLTSGLYNAVSVSSNELVVVSIFSGIISGFISGLICKINTSQGGIILIAQIISKKFKISLSKLNALFSFLIIVAGGITFGFENMLYAIIFIFSSKIVMEKILIGISRKKIFQIITIESEKMKKYLKNNVNETYTTFKVYNGKDNSEKEIIMFSVPTIDYFKLKQDIKKIDPEAFILIMDSYESKGGKKYSNMI